MGLVLAMLAALVAAVPVSAAVPVQAEVWAGGSGGAKDEYVEDLTVDGAGNVYTIGYFEGTADFDPGPGTFNLTSAGSWDAFVQKLNPSGALVWAVNASSGTLDSRGHGIAVDAAGNVYTTGFFSGSADFNPGTGTFNLTSAGSSDGFVQKLDSSGNFVWAVKSASGRDSGFNAESYDVAVDSSGNVYTTGAWRAVVDLDPGSGTLYRTSAGNYDAYVQKLDSLGNLVWAVHAARGPVTDRAHALAIDDDGNVYTAGSFNATTDFAPGSATFNLTSAGGRDQFVQKLDSSGNLIWARNAASGTGDNVGNDLAVDLAGNVHTTGFFEGTSDFDPGPAALNLAAIGGRDTFVQKLDSSGDLVWAAHAVRSTSGQTGHSIAVDFVGNVYTAGEFFTTADFDPGSGSLELTPVGASDGFVQKLDAAGNLVWAANTASSFDVAYASQIAIDGAGDIVTAGQFKGTTDFDPGPSSYPLISNGDLDVYVQRLWNIGPLPVVTPGVVNVIEGNQGTISAHLPVSLSVPGIQPVTVDWSTLNWTATAPDDFVAASGTLTFAPGELLKTVPITINSDDLYEATENVMVLFSNPTNAEIGGLLGLGAVNIFDDDPMPSVRPSGVVIAEGTGGSSLWDLPVTLSAPSGAPVSIDWATTDIPGNPNIAHPDTDFVAASGTLTFLPGETAKSIQLEILGDAEDEPPLLYGEWGLVTFSNPQFATLDTSGFFGLGLFIIIDDDP